MIEWVLDFAFGWVPWWAWAGLALLALGGVYRWVGWQGMVALSIGIAAFFGYRQGWNDKSKGNLPIIPVDPIKVPTTPITPQPRKRRTLMDIINDKTNSQ